MLDVLRKRKRSWIIVFLIGMIVVVFVLWGVGSQIDDPRLGTVAEVNGEVISQREFEIQYQRLIELYRNLFKDSWTPEAIRALNLKRDLVDDLIHRRLVLQEARRMGIQVSDEELMEAIARMPDFQVNGRFNNNRYLQLLRLNRLTPAQFEMEQRRDLTIQKLYDLIQDNVHVGEAELRERYRFEQEQINLYFVRLAVKDFLPQVEATAEEIKDYYERNKEALREPLRVQVEYLAYPFDHFASTVQPSGKEIEEFYKSNFQTRFREPRAVRLRQIFFRMPVGAGHEKEKVRAKAESVLRETRAGKDFGQLAKEHSDDPSAAKAGNVGWFAPGQMLPQLEQVAFTLKKGEVSDLVETSLGYHILKVEETRAEKTKSLQEARQEIVRTLKVERGRSEAGKAADADREKAISGTDLSSLAKERNIPFKVSPFLASSDTLPDVGSLGEFYRTVFSLSLREVSSPVEGNGAYYIVRVRERKEPSVAPLDLLRAEIEKSLKGRKAMELATKKGNALLQQLKKERDIRKLAQEHRLEVGETGWFSRNAPQIPRVGVLQEAKPGWIPISKQRTILDRIYTQKEAIYLFAFKESREVDMERFGKDKASLEEQVLVEKRRLALQKFIESLKVKARIEVRSQFLEEG